jgi:hypothetical protein
VMDVIDLYPILYKTIVCCTAPAAIGFPIWYHLRLRWQDSPMGRHVMGYSVVVGLLYLTTILRVFFPGLLAQRVITLLLAVGMLVVVWWRVFVFVRIYHQTRDARVHRQHEVEDESIKP